MPRFLALVVAIFLLSLFFFAEASRALPICDDGYGLCMRNCTDDKSAERCMQRCQEATNRCAKSGIFRMPVGFLLNKRRMEDMSYAEGELPRSGKRRPNNGYSSW